MIEYSNVATRFCNTLKNDTGFRLSHKVENIKYYNIVYI